MTDTSSRDPFDEDDPRRVGEGLITGSSHSADHTVTSMGAREREVDERVEKKGTSNRSLDVPSGLQPDIME